MVPESPRGRDDILLERRMLMQADGIPADDIPDELVGLIIPWLDRWVLLSGKLTNCTVWCRTTHGTCDTKYGIRDGVYARYPEEPIGIGTTTFIPEYVYDDGESRWFPGNDGGRSPHHLFSEHAAILQQVRDARRKVVDPVDRCLVHRINPWQYRDYNKHSTVCFMRKPRFAWKYEITDLEAVLSRINPQQRMNEWIDDFLKRYEEEFWNTAPHNPLASMVLTLHDRADGVSGHFCIGRSRGSYTEFWNEQRGWCSAGTVYFGRQEAEERLSQLSYHSHAITRPLDATITAHARQRFQESFNSLTIDGNAPEFAAPDHE